MSNERGAADNELIAACARGERTAFETLVSRHGGAVFRFLRRRAADPASVEDAWQETLLTAWTMADSYRGEGALRSWLFTIARRKQGRLETRVAPGLGGDRESLDSLGERAGWGWAEPQPMGPGERLRVRQAFSRLLPDDREILWLRDVEEFTNREAAEILDIGLAAVKSRLHRARLRLMAVLLEGSRNEG